MDLVEGVSLRAAMAGARMAPRRAIAIARQILAGLAHAHAQGTIHRDIKPENVLLAQTAGLEDHVHKRHPTNAAYAAALARLSFERRLYAEGLASFRAAIRLEPRRRSDAVLIEHVLDSLRSDQYAGTAEELLRDLGSAAKPHVAEAARSHPNGRVKTRARDLLRQWDRRPQLR